MTRGTPKSLSGAIRNGLDDIQQPWTKDFDVKDLREHIKDFLGQKFTVAQLKHPEAADWLMELFEICTREES